VVHFDIEWDIGHRPDARGKIREAEQVLRDSEKFGEIECDREIDLTATS